MTLKEAKALLKIRRTNVRETERLIAENPDTDLFHDQLQQARDEAASLQAFIRTHEPKVIIGVDPALEASGVAAKYLYESGSRVKTYGVVNGIENLSGHPILADLKLMDAGKCPVYALVEYPTWRGHGAEQVRAAANCWIRTLKAMFPRRVRVMKVTPQTWMSHVIPEWHTERELHGSRPADLYVPAARAIACDDGPLDENAAAAICLMSFAEKLIAGGSWGTDIRRKSTKPVPRKRASK